MAPIRDAAGDAVPLSPPLVLDVSDGIAGLTQPLTVIRLSKSINNFQVSEAPTTVQCEGVLGPLQARQLELKPEGQRAWSWHQLIVTRDVLLEVDDRATVGGTPFRVMAKFNYASYGFYEYHLLEDYAGGGMPVSRAYVEVYFDGAETTLQVDVSGYVEDAEAALWSLQDLGGTVIDGAVAPLSAGMVQISIDPAPAAGIYRLVGVS